MNDFGAISLGVCSSDGRLDKILFSQDSSLCQPVNDTLFGNILVIEEFLLKKQENAEGNASLSIKYKRDGNLVREFDLPRPSTCTNDQFDIIQDSWDFKRVTFEKPKEEKNSHSFFYVDDVCDDKKNSRVIIGNADKFDKCTLKEIQITKQWPGVSSPLNNTSIIVKCKLTKFSVFESLYLYVFNHRGKVNESGYHIGHYELPPPTILTPTILKITCE